MRRWFNPFKGNFYHSFNIKNTFFVTVFNAYVSTNPLFPVIEVFPFKMLSRSEKVNNARKLI